jgi:mannosyltransferase
VRHQALGAGILLLATFVRLGGLGGQSLWLDEAFSHLFATLPPDTAWRAVIVDGVHPPLYYLLLRVWLVLAGQSEFALRFPSALTGVLTVALLLRAGWTWMDRRIARWGALLIALNPLHVWYSQEGRMYALLALLALAGMMVFSRALDSRRLWAWGGLVVVSTLAYLTHYFALYLPLVEFAFVLATFGRQHRVLARWAVAQALAVLPLAAWLTALYTVGGGTFGIGWIPRPRLADLLRTLWSFGMAYDARVTPLVVTGLLTWGGLLAIGVWRGRGRAVVQLLLILALTVPLLVTFLLSLRRPTYVDRFFIGSLSVFLLLAAAGLVRLPRLAGWAVGLALVGLSLWGVARFRTDPLFIKEDWRGAVAYIEAHETVGDILAVRHFQYVVPFRYYYRGALELAAVTHDQHTTPLADIAVGHERLWLVFRGRHDDPHHLAWSAPFVLERDETDPVVRAWIADHLVAEVVAFPGLTVMLFDLGGNP